MFDFTRFRGGDGLLVSVRFGTNNCVGLGGDDIIGCGGGDGGENFGFVSGSSTLK